MVTDCSEVDQLFDRIVQRFPSRGLRALLVLREEHPFAMQEFGRLLMRDASLGERLHTSYVQLQVNRPPTQPFTARDAIDSWGYRRIHCNTIGNAISDVIGPAYRTVEAAPFWWWTYLVASICAVLAERLDTHRDDAFPAAFIRHISLLLLHTEAPNLIRAAFDDACKHGRPLWESERALYGIGHIDLGRRLVESWGGPETLLNGFNEGDTPGSLSGLVVRSVAAAARHSFSCPLGPVLPASASMEREPIIDRWVERLGGPGMVLDQFRGMMSTARIPLE